MKKYQVIISNVATKELRNLPKEIIPVLYHKMLLLSEEPRPAGCKKLVGNKEAIWRIRVGDYRITYSIDDVICIVDIRHVGHRKDIYMK